MAECCITNCTQTVLPLFPFPQEKELLNKWKLAINSAAPNNTDKICAAHFKNSDICVRVARYCFHSVLGITLRVILRQEAILFPNAVPSKTYNETLLGTYDVSKICQTCPSKNKNLQSLCENGSLENRIINNLIKKLLSIDILENGVPNKICWLCFDQLYAISKFINSVKENEKLLKKIVNEQSPTNQDTAENCQNNDLFKRTVALVSNKNIRVTLQIEAQLYDNSIAHNSFNIKYNISKICRFCLQQSKNLTLVFEEELFLIGRHPICDVVEVIAGVFISKYDGLPTKSCWLCLDKFHSIIKLKNSMEQNFVLWNSTQSKDSDTFSLSMLSNANKDSNQEDVGYGEEDETFIHSVNNENSDSVNSEDHSRKRKFVEELAADRTSTDIENSNDDSRNFDGVSKNKMARFDTQVGDQIGQKTNDKDSDKAATNIREHVTTSNATGSSNNCFNHLSETGTIPAASAATIPNLEPLAQSLKLAIREHVTASNGSGSSNNCFNYYSETGTIAAVSAATIEPLAQSLKLAVREHVTTSNGSGSSNNCSSETGTIPAVSAAIIPNLEPLAQSLKLVVREHVTASNGSDSSNNCFNHSSETGTIPEVSAAIIPNLEPLAQSLKLVVREHVTASNGSDSSNNCFNHSSETGTIPTASAATIPNLEPLAQSLKLAVRSDLFLFNAEQSKEGKEIPKTIETIKLTPGTSNDNNQVKLHEQIHKTKSSSYKCWKCRIIFASRNSLNTHFCNIGKILCKYCNKWVLKDSLYKHKETHRVIKCSNCTRTFLTRYCLLQHTNSVHKLKKESYSNKMC